MLLFVVVALSDGTPLWEIASVLAIVGGIGWSTLWFLSRFTEQGQAERRAMEEQGALGPLRKGNLTSRGRAIAFTIAAIGSFLTGFQGFFNPADGEGLGVSSLLIAAVFGFFAFREYRKGRVEPDPTIFGDLLATPKPAPTKPEPIGSPRTTLIVIAIFVILLTIADIRLIVRAVEPNDVLIGIGQMVIWLPVFGYLAYREVRRMKASRPDQT
jgi:hypothetical protein